ncbi:MAG: TRAP transporter substrate-binding protein [Gammaproteobacteria bacterium]|nr:TRAP transporter substrate-binding protein [Gammaproteobacteria bacterium]
MKRRNFISAVGATAAIGSLSSCSNSEKNCSTDTATKQKVIKWKMVTTWPKNFQGLGEGAEFLARIINEMSGGRLNVKVYGSGELVPALQTFDAVSSGTAEMGHGASYYWKGKMPSAPFFTTVPFGLNATEIQGWLLKGGGYELWRELYQPFGVRPYTVGNTGVQMAGWFNKKIKSLEDIKGLKMRIPGLGGEVLDRAGGTPVLIPGGEVFTALETGAVDAAEFVGPYNDLAMGLYKAAKYYYYPGWHEPGTTAEAIINQEAFDALPEDLQMIVEQACHAASLDMQAEFTAKNNSALQVLINEHQVQLLKLPDDVLIKLRKISEQVVEDIANNSEIGKRIFKSYNAYKKQVRSWHAISEYAYNDSLRLSD